MSKTKSRLKSSSLSLSLACSILVAATGGCGGEPADEPASEQTPLTVTDPCAPAAPDQFLGRFDLAASTSPTTYSNPACSKNWVFQGGSPLFTDDRLTIGWTDMRLRTPVECTGGQLNMRILRQSGSTWITEVTRSAPLVWSGSTQSCLYPIFVASPATPGTMQLLYVDSATGGVVSTSSQTTPVLQGKGKTLKIITQALTPRGSTQSVSGRIQKSVS